MPAETNVRMGVDSDTDSTIPLVALVEFVTCQNIESARVESHEATRVVKYNISVVVENFLSNRVGVLNQTFLRRQYFQR